ncbi:MAG: ACT domain-containing protein [Candidatus Pacebacteria bacterium]|nr:ACT domain-containing protein [Candidatus Paceibacterota bacterium]
MNKKLQEIIENSSFTIEEGKFIYAKVKRAPHMDCHFTVAKDSDEITVITKKENLNKLDLIEKNKDFYRLIALNVSVPFYSVGFLSAVSDAVAKEGMNILIVSTYSKDYIMVKDDCLEKVRLVLLSLGFKRKKEI